MLNKVKEHPAVGKLITRFDQLPRRDQQALQLLCVAIVLALLYFGVWRPVDNFHDRAREARENAGELLAWMQANRQSIQQLAEAGEGARAGTTSTLESGRDLMATVTRTAGEANLSLQRFEPSGESAIRVWLENVPFAAVAAWLERLNSEHGVVIDQAAMDRKDSPGIISARFTLAI